MGGEGGGGKSIESGRLAAEVARIELNAISGPCWPAPKFRPCPNEHWTVGLGVDPVGPGRNTAASAAAAH